MSEEHLLLLATLHQRRLAPLSPEPPTPEPFAVPALETALLGLPERLDALQAQIAARPGLGD